MDSQPLLLLFLAVLFNVGGYSAKTTIKEEDNIMAKRGKKYTEAVKLIERSKAYSVN